MLVRSRDHSGSKKSSKVFEVYLNIPFFCIYTLLLSFDIVPYLFLFISSSRAV